MSLSDRVDDEVAAAELRSGRTAPPTGPRVKYNGGKTLEIEALPVPEGQSAESALLAFLDGAMGDDSGLVDALDLAKMSLSLMYDDTGTRRLAWIKCPVDTTKIRSPQLRAEAAAFVDQVSRRGPRVKPQDREGDTTDLWCVGDLQLGKQAQAFGGLARTMGRLDWLIRERLPATTDRPDRIHIAALGDLGEGCMGSYENQQWTTTLNTAEQFRAALGILWRLIERALDLAPYVDISAVASNHDQLARGAGRKNVTDDWDDRSFMLLDALALAVAANPDRYHDRVRFLVPENPLVAGFTIRGTNVATTHGHQVRASGAGGAVAKMNGWWGGQIKSRHGAAAAANVLIAAHHHHHYVLRDGGRLLIGTPALDGGSAYMHDGAGVWSMPGFVTVKFDDYGVRSTDLHTWPEDRARAAELGMLSVA